MSISRKTSKLSILVSLALTIPFLSSPTIATHASAYFFAMPEEQVNYTITKVNDSLWAKIDGTYPIIYTGSETSIPMIYPTPPGTTNISIWLNNDELDWSKLTEEQPNALHHTALGDWPEILTVLQNVSGDFVLRIHYEHPLQVVNGSFTFLYDLNIQEYLSAEQNTSVAHFTITLNIDYANLMINTVDPETETLKPIAFTVLGEKPAEIRINELSEFNATLPGDLLVSFSAKTANDGVMPIAAASAIIAGLFLVVVVAYAFARRRRNKRFH